MKASKWTARQHAEGKYYICIFMSVSKNPLWQERGQGGHRGMQICRWKQKQHICTHARTHGCSWRRATFAGTAVRDGWLHRRRYTRARGCVNGASSSSFIRQWYRKDGCHTEKKITHLLGLWSQTNTARQKIFGTAKRKMCDRQPQLLPVTVGSNYNACSAYCFTSGR